MGGLARRGHLDIDSNPGPPRAAQSNPKLRRSTQESPCIEAHSRDLQIDAKLLRRRAPFLAWRHALDEQVYQDIGAWKRLNGHGSRSASAKSTERSIARSDMQLAQRIACGSASLRHAASRSMGARGTSLKLWRQPSHRSRMMSV